MNSIVTLDRAGRIVLPKTLRDELHLTAGDTLDILVKGDELILRPRRSATPLRKERGVWVYRTDEPLTADETTEMLRRTRQDSRSSIVADSVSPRARGLKGPL